MVSSVRRSGVAALAGLAVWGALSAPAHAQLRPRPGTTTIVTPAPVVNPFLNPFLGQNRVVPFMPSLAAQSINQSPYLTPFMTQNQFAFNTAVLGRALSNVPPYALGYNPYPQLVNYGPSFPTVSPYGGSTLSTVGASNPYLGGGSGGATLAANPYLGGVGAAAREVAGARQARVNLVLRPLAREEGRGRPNQLLPAAGEPWAEVYSSRGPPSWLAERVCCQGAPRRKRSALGHRAGATGARLRTSLVPGRIPARCPLRCHPGACRLPCVHGDHGAHHPGALPAGRRRRLGLGRVAPAPEAAGARAGRKSTSQSRPASS
jgi:hypothetical protein